jgi:hypothetical protein
MRKPQFITDHYEWSHGKPPSGRGTWAFGTKSNPDVLNTKECFFTTCNTLYSEAKKEAAQWAVRNEEPLIYVLP